MKRNKKIKAPVLIAASILLILLVIGFNFYEGNLQINHLSHEDYPVRGVDVSSYQGDIDWNVLSGESIQFAYIKATEGSSYQDEYFERNWDNALTTDLKTGAYHFFSFDSSGETQAENFINTVPKVAGTLPPAIDLEFYGDYHAGNITPEKQVEIIQNFELLYRLLEDHYGVKPIIYVTEDSYKTFHISSDHYRLWVRSVYSSISYVQNNEWCFWQYSNRIKLNGYNGVERFIDLNAYNGSMDEFHKLLA